MQSLTGFLSSSFSLESSASRFLFGASPVPLLATDDGGEGFGSSGIGVDSFEGPLGSLLPDTGVSGTREGLEK